MSNLISINKEKQLNVKTIQEGKSKSYPYQWFNQNPGTKPRISIRKVTNLDRLRGTIKGVIRGSAVPVESVVSYLYAVLSRREETLTSEWKSYNVLVGSAGTRVNPFSLLSVVELDEVERAGDEATAEESEDRWLCMWLLSMYRLEKADDPTYRANLATNLSQHIKQAGGPDQLNLITGVTTCKKWTQSPDYRKIVAAVDMFFFKFDTSEWATIRVATVNSRFRDCAALLSLYHLGKLLGIKSHHDLLTWVSCATIGAELDDIFDTDDEYDLPDSYFPYLVDMGLSVRSPYSSKENPALHTYCHIIGLYLGSTRSQNARYILDKDVKGVLHNAQWVAYVFYRNTSAGRQFVKPLQDVQAQLLAIRQAKQRAADPRAGVPAVGDEDQEDAELIGGETPEPISQNVDEWFDYMESREWVLSDPMVQLAKKVSDNITNPRPGTIAEFAKRQVFLGE